MSRTEDQKVRRRITDAKYRAENKAKVKAYRDMWLSMNPTKQADYSRKKRELHPEKAKAAWVKWRAKNPGYQNSVSKRWAKNNREKINRNERKRCSVDAAYKLTRNLRNRLRHEIKKGGANKHSKALELVGCDVQFLMGYLEARFKPGMTWKNHGTTWEMDHRIPCASYDMTDPSHQKSCFHYSNLQPLFTTNNRKKHSKIPEPHQAELI